MGTRIIHQIPADDSAERQTEMPEGSPDVNNSAEMPSVMPFNDEVVESTINWGDEPVSTDPTDVQPVHGDQLEPGDLETETETETETEFEGDVEDDVMPDDDLTKAMRDRIVRLKQAEAKRLANKDQQIDVLSEELQNYRNMVEDFSTKVKSVRFIEGDPDALQTEIDSIDADIQERADELTAGEVHQLSRRQAALIEKRREILSSREQVQGLQSQREQLRAESDARTKRNYAFVEQPDTPEYNVLKNQAYPMLESLIPGFKDAPWDLAIAAELTQMMVDASAYRRLMGKRPVNDRQEPQILSQGGGGTPPAPRKRGNTQRNIQRMRSGEMSATQVLNEMGIGWFPEKNS